MTVHEDGICVHTIDQPHLAPLAKLLIKRGYGIGDRRIVLAHALGFGTVAGATVAGLLRPEDYPDAEAALAAGAEAELPIGAAYVPPELELLNELLGDESDVEYLRARAAEEAEARELARRLPPVAGGSDLAVAVVPSLLATVEIGVATPKPQTLVEWVDHEALGYRAWGSDAGNFLAEQMERVAQLLRFTGATTAAEYAQRIEANEFSVAEQHFEHGYKEGRGSALNTLRGR